MTRETKERAPGITAFSDIVEDNGKTIRENNMELQHKIPIGALVEVKYDRWHGNGCCEKIHARLFVIEHGRDCDGTPLYSLANQAQDQWDGETFNNNRMFMSFYYGEQHGFAEESLTVVELTNEIVRGEGALQWEYTDA